MILPAARSRSWTQTVVVPMSMAMAIVALTGIAGFDLHDPGFPGPPLGKVQGGGDPEVVLPHHLGQMAQHEEIGGQAVQAVLAGQALLQAGQIADIVRQGRRRQRHEFLLKGRVIEPGGLQGLQVDGAGAQTHASPGGGSGCAGPAGTPAGCGSPRRRGPSSGRPGGTPGPTPRR